MASTDSCGVDDRIPCVSEDLKYLTNGHFDECAKVVSHCNGIICFYDYDCHKEDYSIFLVNPALRELKAVPDARFGDGYEIRGVGFGYDSRADDYEVLAIKSEDPLEPGHCKAEVYSFGTNSWKEIKLNVEIIDFSTYEYQVVYCKGVCYWYNWFYGGMIISFDFSNEVFRNVPFPRKAPSFIEPDEVLEKLSKIVVWNESIALFFYLELDPFHIDMWVMDACSSSGDEDSCSSTRHLIIGPLVGINQPVVFWDNVNLFMEDKEQEIISYNIDTKKFNGPSICMEWLSNCFVICETSLVSVLKQKSGQARLQRD